MVGFRQRPEATFESLYSRHVRDVYGYALGVLGSSADAEDVTQTTFLNAYRALKGGQRPRTPRSWLFAIAHNVCRQRFRQAARRPREVELHDAFAVEEETDAPSAHDIARALQSLPFTQRSALVMRELEGRSQGEIADAVWFYEEPHDAVKAIAGHVAFYPEHVQITVTEAVAD